jgi:hypothetical protein
MDAHADRYRLTLEKEAELELMRSKKRQERDYFKKMETGELQPRDEEKKPKLLIGKIKDVSRPIEFKELCILVASSYLRRSVVLLCLFR